MEKTLRTGADLLSAGWPLLASMVIAVVILAALGWWTGRHRRFDIARYYDLRHRDEPTVVQNRSAAGRVRRHDINYGDIPHLGYFPEHDRE